MIEELSKAVSKAPGSENDPRAREIKALDTLINEAFRIAAQGPEFVLPAIVAFLDVAEKSQSLIGVECPTTHQALVDCELHIDRGELVRAQVVLCERLEEIVKGSVYHSSQQIQSTERADTQTKQPRRTAEEEGDTKIATEFGVPLIHFGLHGQHVRLPRHTDPIENAILTSSFLTLVEECLHASQEQRRARVEDLYGYRAATGVTEEELSCSRLAPEFFRERSLRVLPKHPADGFDSKTLEIDVVARAVELAREHNFPLPCLTLELQQYHEETRSDFVAWLTDKEIVPSLDSDKDFFFKGRGQAEAVPRSERSLTSEGEEILELLKEAGTNLHRGGFYKTMSCMEKIVGDPAELAHLQMCSDRADRATKTRVLKNVKAGEKAEAIPSGWHAFAEEELRGHEKKLLVGLIMEEYLYRIGFLKEK